MHCLVAGGNELLPLSLLYLPLPCTPQRSLVRSETTWIKPLARVNLIHVYFIPMDM